MFAVAVTVISVPATTFPLGVILTVPFNTVPTLTPKVPLLINNSPQGAIALLYFAGILVPTFTVEGIGTIEIGNTLNYIVIGGLGYYSINALKSLATLLNTSTDIKTEEEEEVVG